MASTRTRIQRLVHTVSEAENDTYDRACFLYTFLAEPVVKSLLDLDRHAIQDLVQRLSMLSTSSEWRSTAGAVELVANGWPFLRLEDNAEDAYPLLLRAAAAVLLASDGIDTLWETKWRSLASPGSLTFEANWKDTSVDLCNEWAVPRLSAVMPQPLLKASRFSS